MTPIHSTWNELPPPVRAAVTARTGPATAAHDIDAGFNCQLASTLHTNTGGVFLKGLQHPDAAALARQQTEHDIAPHTGATGPRLRHRIRAHGWDILVFDLIDGRHARLAPGSPDLPLVADLLHATAVLPAPACPRLPPYAGQWVDHATPGALALLDGDGLVHADINPHNLLIDPRRAWLVDWAMPARGPAWIDIAETAIRLMEDGHAAADAHTWAQQLPAWRDADPAAIRVWTDLRCRALTAAVGETGARPSNARHHALAAAVTTAAVGS